MEEILPGVFHWTAYHQGIRQDVHSYLFVGAGALLDPMLPEEGLDWFEGDRMPARILLTNRHHYRHSADFAEAFGCPVLCHEAGLHEFGGGRPVEGFAFGDEVAPGVFALEVGAICPEETALHLRAAAALAVADGVIRRQDELAFVPDYLLGDDPEAVKRGLCDSYGQVCERHEFDHLLLAHGTPVLGDGRRQLAAFCAGA
jgi:hypothetical protein